MTRIALALALALAAAGALAQDAASPAAPSAPSAPAAPAATPAPTAYPTPVIRSLPAPAASGAAIPSVPAVPAATASAPAPAIPDFLERNDFQDLVEQSSGKALGLFGANLFTGPGATFAPLDRVPVPADYVIGPGDEIVIRAWGQIDLELSPVVDRNGQITLPRVGSLNVAGLRYSQLPGFLRGAIGRMFRNFELSVSLGQLRSIQIFVLGQARRPGSYTVGSLSTLVNALFASGGPSARGSMRRIQLKRGADTVVEFDLYDLLLRGDKSRDAQLLPGDVIFIPTVGPLAAVYGGVQTQAVFELRGDTTLAGLIELAGGLSTTAAAEKVMVERIAERRTRVVEVVPYTSAGLATRLRDGDLVQVLNITPKFDNAVTLRGNVAAPMRFPWRAGMRVRDLVPDRASLIVPGYWTRRNAAVRADIANEGDLRSSLKRTLPEVNWEYAVIDRLNLDQVSTTLIPFDLGKAVMEGDPAHNIALEAGDVLTVFSKDDVQVPIERRNKFVRVEGEVAAPGIYQLRPGETVRQLLARVSPLTPAAYVFGTELMRESARVVQQARLDEALARLAVDVERNAINLAQAAVTPEAVSAAHQQALSQRALVDRLRQMKATGRVVLEVPQGASKPADLPDLALEDGDRLLVPARPSVISVVGSVNGPNTFAYAPARRVADYLALAGGPTKDADEGALFVLRADGTVLGATGGWFGRGLGGADVLPGDAVFVPEKLDKFVVSRGLRDWTQIFYQFALGAAALKVLRD